MGNGPLEYLSVPVAALRPSALRRCPPFFPPAATASLAAIACLAPAYFLTYLPLLERMVVSGGILSSGDKLRDALGLGGFSFDNTRRNQVLALKGHMIPKARKTGTTIVGVIYDGGVVLGADTRATEGDTVADKNCEKIHYIADNIWCCGAGTSADTESTTALISSQLELHRMSTGKQPRVVTACTMLKRMLFRYQGHVSAALVLGGVDCTGPSLYTVYPHGSTDSLPYVTMGSGSLAAMAVFESEYKSKMTLEEAKALVHAAIMAGINNDLGSGGSVDMMVINKDGNTPLRNYDRPNLRKFRQDYIFPRGTATILSEKFTPLSSLVTIETETSAMQVS